MYHFSTGYHIRCALQFLSAWAAQPKRNRCVESCKDHSMSSIALLGNSPLASFGKSRLSDPVQAACSTIGRLCSNTVRPASSVELHNHMSALSGRALGSGVFNKQRHAIRQTTVISGICVLASRCSSCALKASKRDHTQCQVMPAGLVGKLSH